MTHRHNWTPADDALLESRIGLDTWDSLGKMLGVSAKTAKSRADHLGLSLKPGTRESAPKPVDTSGIVASALAGQSEIERLWRPR